MNYFVVGTNNMKAATAFYDGLFDGLGVNKMVASERMTYWLADDFAFAVALPFDEKPATNGNGTMVGFNVGSPDAVDRVHQLALDLGAADEGAPCPKGPKYSGYVRDLDGNKICLSD
ncbi:Glyoxalase-like domain protein [Octadecabacter ascidiaceicola]|uniref:Glyoxalase-like domain protein n=2 Tax=Octadecabacter ascidiaceicola TaxID=1655543 RepID=A0A238K8Y8_9RHOB|nr:Glyoxalase-like domain protein [Octadecabacter ascidiaceicola]